MNDFWLNLLGVDPATIPDDARTGFTLLHEPHSWTVFPALAGVLAVMYGVFWLYRREMPHVSRRACMALAAVRCAVLGLIVLVLLGPALAFTVNRPETPIVIVMVDDSASMSVGDGYRAPDDADRVASLLNMSVAEVRRRQPTRAEIVNALVRENGSQWVRELTDKGHVRIFTFSREANLRRAMPWRGGESPRAAGGAGGDGPVEAPTPDAPTASGERTPSANTGRVVNDRPMPTITADGGATNLARSLRQAMESVGGAPLAGVIILTDGQNTEGDDPSMIADAARNEDVPLFTVGIGDAADPRNVRVADVWAPERVFRDDPFVVETRITADNAAGETARVELFAALVNEDGSVAEPTLVDGRTVAFEDDTTERRLSFQYTPGAAGDYILTVEAEPIDDEIIESDNTADAAVTVLSDKSRVLLVAGGPSWEYRMLINLLMRDSTTDVSGWLQSLDADVEQWGDTVIREFPDTAEDLFDYDVIVLIDPDPRRVSTDWLDLLERFVGEHGGGLMWVAGPKHTARFLTYNRTEPIRQLLPVRTGRLDAADVESLVTTHTNQWPLRITADGADHAMMRFDRDPAVNRRIWEAMPGIYWSFPADRAKLGATVLLEHSDPRLNTPDGGRPLLVAGQFGPGRTVYLGFSGTWRWRKLGARYFDQFWIQSVRYLVEGRLVGGQRRGSIRLDNDVYRVGDRIRVSAELRRPDYDPYEADALSATLQGPDGAVRFQMRPVPDQPGEYQGTVLAAQVGLNEIRLALTDPEMTGDGETMHISRQVRVELPRVEFVNTRLDRERLRDLARRGDGRYFEVDQVHQIPQAVPDRRQTIVIPGKPIELWDNALLLTVLVCLLTVEWGVRKGLKMM